ncbi:MAG TPA: TlyA family RNA methyltransferase [Candidatus Hydrogenedentes bacterium]|nr:TlyA family RNA methyltransferase [Candidatus Hydrogenedentota bacterium]HRK34276.1 TlyA family RNA methyltransferase [Candidatus Hydrogenedentota bacterium]
MKARLDTIVARQGGVTRTLAQGLIRAGKVQSKTGEVLDKPALLLDEDETLLIENDTAYVSRGGDKLAAALAAFSSDVKGKVAIDVGASTGGFTDCLLQHGAARVYAVDVGYGQLAWKLRNDARVVVLERTNIRHLEPRQLEIQPNFFTADCSFISLRLVLPPLKTLLAPSAQGIVLIKPQFEAGKASVGKKGVVRDPKVHEIVVSQVLEAAQALGFRPGGVIESPLVGPAGNREFLAELTYIA